MLAWVVWLLLPAPGLRAGVPSTRISLSQQFVVSGLSLDPGLSVSPVAGAAYVQLEPNTAVVSCERIKQAVLRELRLEDRWRDKIYLRLLPRPVGSDEERIVVEAEHAPSGWTYRISMSEQVNRRRFVSTMVEVILLEIANRGARDITAELPRWLGTGLTAVLEARGAGDLVVDPFLQRMEVHRADTVLRTLREHLRAEPALTLDELSWPPASPSPAQIEHYRMCAHLLLTELLRLEDGPQRLGRMVTELSKHLNWQITFLQAFAPRFARLSDAEKWWGVTTAHFIGRDSATELPAMVALEQLSEVLRIPVDARVRGTTRTNAEVITLQRVVQEWEPLQLEPLFARKLGQLESLQWRAPKPVAAMVLEYREVLSEHLRQRSAAGASPSSRHEQLPNAKILKRRTVRQLDELDRARVKLAGELAAAPPSAAAGPAPLAPSPPATQRVGGRSRAGNR